MNFLTIKSKSRKFLSLLGLRSVVLPTLRWLNSLYFRVFSRQHFRVFIENPIDEITTPYLQLNGFIITNKKMKPTEIDLQDAKTGLPLPISSVERFDVKRNFVFQNSIAFFTPPISISDRPEFEYKLNFQLGNLSCEHLITLKNSANVQEFLNLKKDKLNRIREILQCPVTKSADLNFQDATILVNGNDLGFTYSPLVFDFLSQELKAEIKVVPTENVSAMDYFAAQENLVSKTGGGLILDHGCGLKVNYHPQVVYYDIADYPTTDVRGAAENLPFRDGVFDAVLSHAVLEHIRDPFKCAEEILRVLKPGGIVHIAAAFLQPLHGYPNHYYNMSLSGLMNLFGDNLKVENVEVGHPFEAFSWFVNSYMKGLSRKDQKRFLNSRIRDFEYEEEIMNQTFAREVSDSTKRELATWYAIIGKKV